MSPRPQIDHIRRPQLLAAAASVIAERGVAATRIADVAERAGTSTSGVLYWFDSRDQLLAEALTFTEDAFYADLAARLAALSDPREKVLELIDASLGGEDWVMWIELWARALRDRKMAKARQDSDDRWRATIASVVGEGAEAGVFSDADPERVAIELAALMDGLAVQVALRDERVSLELTRSICVDVAERLLGAALDPLEAPG